MDLYEQLVETYLTVIEECAVIPQVPIRENRKGEKWEAYPDFLALNFSKRMIQVVEVNKSTGAQRITNLIQRRFQERADIEHYVQNHTLSRQLNFAALGWRFFIRQGHASVVNAMLRDLGFEAEVTYLEAVFDALRDKMP